MMLSNIETCPVVLTSCFVFKIRLFAVKQKLASSHFNHKNYFLVKELTVFVKPGLLSVSTFRII